MVREGEGEGNIKKTWRSTDQSSVVLQLSVAAEGFGQVDELVPLSLLRVQQSVLVVLALRLPRPPVHVRHRALDHEHLRGSHTEVGQEPVNMLCP